MEELKRVELETLKAGDIFLYGNNPYIKTPYVSGNEMHMNCVNLTTGEPELLTAKTLVIRVEAELTVY